MRPVDLLEPGVDPFDALRGARVPGWARRSPRARQAVIQLRKRCPIDLAAVLGVQPFIMAKALGCGLAAAARLQVAGERCCDEARALATALLACEGHVGDGAWGYEFDVQTRWAFYPRGSANLIATVFVGRGFLEAALVFGDEEWLAEALAAARYLQQEHLDHEGRTFFRYTIDSSKLVHNANLLASGFVAAVGRLSGEMDFVNVGVEAAATSIAAQGDDGGWPYGDGSGLAWDDNFHTAYDLDGLMWVWLASRDAAAERALGNGAASWSGAFFGSQGEPKYYRARSLPYDIHAASTAVDTACRLSSAGIDVGELPERVASWTKAVLIDPSTGRTRYQVRRWGTDGRDFARWGDAHWLLATSSLTLRGAGYGGPVEETLLAGRSWHAPLREAGEEEAVAE